MPEKDHALAFIIPLRARSTTTRWPLVSQLLMQTLASITNSRDSRYRVFVVGHDRPEPFPNSDRIEFIAASFPAPSAETLLMKDRERIFHWRTDKGRKILLGIKIVREIGYAYFMPTDADDLISSRIVGCCLDRNSPNGYYIEYGLKMEKLSDSTLFRRRNFFRECGTSSILRTDKAPFPGNLDLSLDFNDYYIRRYVNHAYIPSCMEGLGTPLQRIPFPAVIYRFHGQNIYAASIRRPNSRLRRIAALLIKGVRVTDPLRREFMIP